MENILQKFEINEVGNDWVVGDIHGMFDLLERQLHDIGFNKKIDRLFSVGDLVDRGPKSELCLEYINQPWFFCTLGNHEEMAVEFYDGLWDTSSYISNGGQWFVDLGYDERERYVDVFKSLPLAMEIKTQHETIGVVHAEVPLSDWRVFENKTKDELKQVSIWSRNRIRANMTHEVIGIDKVYVGHTVLSEPRILGNVFYIDTGSVFNGNDLTIRKLS